MVSALRWMMVIVVLAGLIWLVLGVLRQPPERSAEREAAVGAEK